jgi:predicted NBD/HSP70 family sugar kinase
MEGSAGMDIQEMTATDWTFGAQEDGRDIGANQSGMRQFNERIVLQIIRRAGSLPKADIARISNLSAQTVSVIINRLIEDGLLLKQEPVKGKVGQPSVPIALNPHGAHAIGISIGRRHLDTLLIDFGGSVQERTSRAYAFPDPDAVFPQIKETIAQVMRAIPPAWRDRMVGVGVAAPFMMGHWAEQLAAPVAVMRQWNEIDIRDRIGVQSGYPTFLAKDTTAACLAELVFGTGTETSNYLYLFVGTFIGGGVVLNGALFTGMFGNAGAVGSIPVPDFDEDGRVVGVRQLLECASLCILEDALAPLGVSVAQAGEDSATMPDPVRALLERWIARSARAIAWAIAAACGVVDFEAVVLDGTMPRPLLDRLVAAVEAAMDQTRFEGELRPRARAGTVGADARALGGAILPLYSNFAPIRKILLNRPSGA